MSFPTWSDLNSESIVPPLGTNRAPDMGPVALMVSCRPDINLIKAQLTNPRVFPFFNNTLITSDDGEKGICVAGPYMGAPYGAMLLESLIARGTKKIIVLGWCGAVSHDLNVGDIVLADKAIVDEGTSCNYINLDSDLPCSLPDQLLTDQFAGFLASRTKVVTKQTVWTTDAIYRETPRKVAHFKHLGAHVVEMECSALFSVAQFRKVEITALLVVSDSVASRDWNPGFRKKAFVQGREIACDLALNFTKKMSDQG
ncbi:MAG: nucleoside phosphorylase [Pseudomonadota bacterium]